MSAIKKWGFLQVEEYLPVEEKKKKKTRAADNEPADENKTAEDQPWSQEQQKSLELALTQFPKVLEFKTWKSWGTSNIVTHIQDKITITLACNIYIY